MTNIDCESLIRGLISILCISLPVMILFFLIIYKITTNDDVLLDIFFGWVRNIQRNEVETSRAYRLIVRSSLVALLVVPSSSILFIISNTSLHISFICQFIEPKPTATQTQSPPTDPHTLTPTLPFTESLTLTPTATPTASETPSITVSVSASSTLTATATPSPSPTTTLDYCTARGIPPHTIIYTGPSLNRAQRGEYLEPIAQIRVMGKSTDEFNQTWLSLDYPCSVTDRGYFWVQANAVFLEGNCTSIPDTATPPWRTPVSPPPPPPPTPTPTLPLPGSGAGTSGTDNSSRTDNSSSSSTSNGGQPSPTTGGQQPPSPPPAATFTPTPPPPSGPLSVSDCHENCDPARCRAYLSTQGYNDVHFGSSRASCALSTMTCDCLWR